STSYTPRDPVHDSYVSAPYILDKLKGGHGLLQGMSYWTYSDIFYESGPPPSPFHGGFGLMTVEGVRKPAWFAYKYLRALSGREGPTADPQSWAASDGKRAAAIVWDWHLPDQATSDRPYYTKLHPSEPIAPVTLRFSHLRPGPYRLQVRRTGFEKNDPQSAWIAMGKPVHLSAAQLSRLQSLTRDLPERSVVVRVPAAGGYSLTLPMRTHDVLLVTMERAAR
ncbi:MAG TPA: beta-xylosidase, partial [Stellaceae bacterium]|nr:beta-xylosidase [Stellaceae bacterium]